MLSLRWDYWKEYKLNGIGVTIRLNTHNHKWEVWFGSMHEEGNMRTWRKPDIILTKARGEAVVRVLEGIPNAKG